MANTDIGDIIADLNLSSQVIQGFASLSQEQLNWQPDTRHWSVGQCVDHLRLANLAYADVIKSVLNKNRKATFWEQIPLLPKLFGNILVRSLKPSGGRRIRTTQEFKPVEWGLELDLIDAFMESQDEVVAAMKAVERLDLRKIIVTSVFASFVTYSLLDACRIVAVHERRHILQAKNVMASEGFPV